MMTNITTIQASPARMQGLVDEFVREYLQSQRPDIAGNPVFAPLYDDLVNYLARPGKRIRPLLFLHACEAFMPGVDVEEREFLSVAAAIEMLHGFILIHDDIIDRSDLRRGLPSLHRVIEKRVSSVADRPRIGSNLALVMGDVLFALAQKCLLDGRAGRRDELLSRLLFYVFETGVGEASDIVYGIQDISHVSLHDVEQMYLRKTTRYTIECPLVLAAILAGHNAAQIQALVRLAEPAGLAFQIQNDLQEFARFEISDADIPADLLEGKKTYLARMAFSLLNENDRGILQLCLNGVSPSAASISKVRELVIKSGAFEKSREKMHELFATAVARARHPSFETDAQEGLVALIHFLGELTNGEVHRVYGAGR